MSPHEYDSGTKSPGSVKAGTDRFVFDFDEIDEFDVGPDYSPTTGSVIEGSRLQVGLAVSPKGTGSSLHTHPNEQFNYVLQGELKVQIGDRDEGIVGPGSVIHVPPNVEHSMVATDDEDVVFYVVKDLSHGIAGEAVENGNDPDE